MLDLKIIIASTRPGRAADQVIPWITTMSREHGDFDVDVLDLRGRPLPLFGETHGPRTSGAAKILLDDMAWWAKAPRQARAAGTLPPAAFRLMAVKEGAGK